MVRHHCFFILHEALPSSAPSLPNLLKLPRMFTECGCENTMLNIMPVHTQPQDAQSQASHDRQHNGLGKRANKKGLQFRIFVSTMGLDRYYKLDGCRLINSIFAYRGACPRGVRLMVSFSMINDQSWRLQSNEMFISCESQNTHAHYIHLPLDRDSISKRTKFDLLWLLQSYSSFCSINLAPLFPASLLSFLLFFSPS